jgi:hypothetical protein
VSGEIEEPRAGRVRIPRYAPARSFVHKAKCARPLAAGALAIGVRYHIMPLTVFDTKGIPATRRECIEAAVVAGGKHVAAPHEAWIAADPFHDGVRVLLTGPHGFQRTVTFTLEEVPAAITQRVRETLEE